MSLTPAMGAVGDQPRYFPLDQIERQKLGGKWTIATKSR